MTKFITFFVAAALIISMMACGSKKETGFTINGTITGQDSGLIFLKKREDGKWLTLDSVKIEKGAFTFKGNVDLPELHYLEIANKEANFPFFIENTTLTVKAFADSLDKSVVTGSATHEIYTTFQKQDEMYNQKMEALYNDYMAAKEANDTIKAKGMESGFDAIEKEQSAALKSFILKNGKSVVAPYLALSRAYMFDLESLKEINKAMDPSIAASKYVLKLKEREEILTKLLPGNLAPDFSQADSTGKAISLSSKRGSYVLVDFWASWCGPCRAENPNVVAAYKKYNAKGFTVFGVSFDEDKDRWQAAIAKDGLTWTQVSDLKGWANEAGKLYGVMSIPANFLLDKEGKIIGSNLRGGDLMKKLAELFPEEAKK